MAGESYRFDIGTFRCTLVLDGTHAYPEFARKRFPEVPRERLEKALKTYGLTIDSTYESPYPALVVDTGRNLVLVETGAGDLFPTTGRLLPSLRAIGIDPRDVDTVILTHGHPDHIGGTIDREGRPAFPQSKFYMWKTEWDFWYPEPDSTGIRHESPMREMLIDSARRYLPPIAGQIELLDRETEIVPGFEALAAPGHTCGHMALSVTSQGHRLLFAADAFTPLQIEHPEWSSAYDYSAEQGVATRHRLLSMGTAEGTLMHLFHFPFPGLGHVVASGNEWEWRPLR